jgi:hypothetical protein
MAIPLGRIWSRARAVHALDLSGYGTRASVEDYLHGVFKRDRYLSNLGMEGRQLVVEEAMKEWGQIPADVKLTPLMVMRERGLLSANEFQQFAVQQGYSVGAAEYAFRKWTGTQEAVYDLKFKKLLQYGEYSRLLRSKKLTRGQGYYRYRRHLAVKYGLPFRKFKQGQTFTPRSRYKRQP